MAIASFYKPMNASKFHSQLEFLRSEYQRNLTLLEALDKRIFREEALLGSVSDPSGAQNSLLELAHTKVNISRKLESLAKESLDLLENFRERCNKRPPPNPKFEIKFKLSALPPRTSPSSSNGSAVEFGCVCQIKKRCRMIECDNPYCEIRWFHFSCVGLKKVPTDWWYCPKCLKKKQLNQADPNPIEERKIEKQKKREAMGREAEGNDEEQELKHN